jgi:hypothetical protein
MLDGGATEEAAVDGSLPACCESSASARWRLRAKSCDLEACEHRAAFARLPVARGKPARRRTKLLDFGAVMGRGASLFHVHPAFFEKTFGKIGVLMINLSCVVCLCCYYAISLNTYKR